MINLKYSILINKKNQKYQEYQESKFNIDDKILISYKNKNIIVKINGKFYERNFKFWFYKFNLPSNNLNFSEDKTIHEKNILKKIN